MVTFDSRRLDSHCEVLICIYPFVNYPSAAPSSSPTAWSVLFLLEATGAWRLLPPPPPTACSLTAEQAQLHVAVAPKALCPERVEWMEARQGSCRHVLPSPCGLVVLLLQGEALTAVQNIFVLEFTCFWC